MRLKRIVPLLLLGLLLCGAVLAAEAVEDGEYVPQGFSFSGGSGRVEISCPGVTVSGGEATARLVFSSASYTTLTLDGVTCEGAHPGDGTTVFTVPAPLDRAFTVSAVTTAMSQPHAIEYTLCVRMGGDGLGGLAWRSRLELDYAECFSVDYYEGGFALVTVQDGARWLVVPEGLDAPEGLDPEIGVLRQPVRNIYMAASSAMSLVARLDALDRVRFSATEADGWYVEAAAQAMRAGEIVFAGRYSEPDFELLVKEDCALAVESTMILHTPKVREMLEMLGIPVFIDRSSYEPHPLGRTEWIRLYGVLLGREEEADAFFAAQREAAEAMAERPATGKTAAIFHLNSEGAAVVRGSGDYLPRMLALGGAEYVFSDMSASDAARAGVTLSFEEFYARALDADYLIYSGAIDTTVQSMADLVAREPLLADLRAVREGNVYLTGRELYQATDRAAEFIGDIARMLADQEEGMAFLRRLY